MSSFRVTIWASSWLLASSLKSVQSALELPSKSPIIRGSSGSSDAKSQMISRDWFCIRQANDVPEIVRKYAPSDRVGLSLVVQLRPELPFVSGTSFSPDPVTEQNNRLGMRQ
jgi:hypothetical protein